MKRALDDEYVPTTIGDEKMKKRKSKEEEEEEEEEEKGFVHLDEDLLFEILKHVDSRSLAIAACVNKQWHKTSQDERLWEMICTRHSANISCNNQQLRSVVLALGGFRRLHSLYLWPLLKPPSSSSAASSSSSPSFPSSFPSTSSVIPAKKMPTQWGKDEVNLSLSLLSIRYYEKMNLNNRGSR